MQNAACVRAWLVPVAVKQKPGAGVALQAEVARGPSALGSTHCHPGNRSLGQCCSIYVAHMGSTAQTGTVSLQESIK